MVDFMPQVSFELRRVLSGDASYTDLEFLESDRFTYHPPVVHFFCGYLNLNFAKKTYVLAECLLFNFLCIHFSMYYVFSYFVHFVFDLLRVARI